jgi:hypothetical protein
MAHKFGELRLTSRENLYALNIGEIELRFLPNALRQQLFA